MPTVPEIRTSENLHLRVDAAVKEEFRIACEAHGMSMSQALRHFITTAVSKNRDIIEEVRNGVAR